MNPGNMSPQVPVVRGELPTQHEFSVRLPRERGDLAHLGGGARYYFRSRPSGALRAIGLARWQMLLYLTFEQFLIIFSGAAIGTGLGVGASRLFIPFLRVADAKGATAPPFLVDISWTGVTTVYIAFGVMLVVALAFMAILLSRMRLFEAIKLGETV